MSPMMTNLVIVLIAFMIFPQWHEIISELRFELLFPTLPGISGCDFLHRLQDLRQEVAMYNVFLHSPFLANFSQRMFWSMQSSTGSVETKSNTISKTNLMKRSHKFINAIIIFTKISYDVSKHVEDVRGCPETCTSSESFIMCSKSGHVITIYNPIILRNTNSVLAHRFLYHRGLVP